MKLSGIATLAVIFSLANALPASREGALQARQDRGSYSVPGLGSRKQQVLNQGGNSLDLAIAMLETDTMTTNYAYGMMFHNIY
jgi:hypothetical protein